MKTLKPEKKTIGYLSAVSISVGGMVGGGIFAVLGLAVQLSRGGTPVSFLFAGIIALFTAYSYVKLSTRYPTSGGTVEFIYQAFGPGIFTGGINILLWISYIVMLSLYAYAFGSYGASFFPEASQQIWKHIFTSGAVILFTGLNVLGTDIVGKSEEFIVGIKVIILLVFIGFGSTNINTSNLHPANWSGPIELIAGGMIIFLAYEGFQLISTVTGNMKNPKKILPLAYYSSVIFVIFLYVTISIVVLGNLSFDEILASEDYALAEAAKPFLGNFGFTLIAIAALFSTGSAINATLYGAGRISYVTAKDGELPKQLGKKIWNKPIEGLLITAGLTLLIANLFDLTSIAIMGSSGFLIIFAVVNASNFRLSKKTSSNKFISLLAIILCLSALLTLIIHTIMNEPLKILVLVVMVSIAFLTEFLYKKYSGRIIKSSIKR
jgi:amino acid transporter